MRNTILVLLFLQLFCFKASAQNYYWIAFTDKSNTSYSLSSPEEYLSERAIERRQKQNIAIDSLDLPVNKTYIDSVLSLDVELVHATKWLNGITVKTSLDSLEKQIADWSFIKNIQLSKPNAGPKSARLKFEEELDTLLSIDTSYYGGSISQIEMLNGQYFHHKNIKGQGMQIAVLDAGFYHADVLPAFDSLWQNNQILGTRDFVNPNSDIFSEHYHGMSVLSCMGGNIPGELIGTAPAASYWLLRSEDTGSEYIVEEDHWVAAAEFADSVGVDIINSSLGYYEFDDPNTNHSYADMDGKTTRVTRGANIAASRGILVFASAGNEGNDPWQKIIAPSDGDKVIGVGAVDKNGVPASFTSVGPAFDGDVKPNLAAMGYHTVVQQSGSAIGIANGTSFSSPVLAGMAACLWQENPTHTATEIKAVMEESGRQYNNPDSLLGYGVPNMQLASELLQHSSVKNQKISSEWSVFPNPVQNYVVIQNRNNNSDEVKINLYSISGQLLKQWIKPGNANILLSDLPGVLSGMFLLKISTDHQSETFKLCKSN